MVDERPQLAERLRDVCVTLRPDVEVSRVVLSGEPSYVLRDPITFQCHRFDVHDYHLLVQLTEELTLGEVFDRLAESQILDQQDEEAFYSFIVSLHRLGFLTLPIADAGSLYERFERRKSAKRRSRLLAPLFLQVPLFNPDAFLSQTVRFAAPLFTRAAFIVWAMLIALCVALIGARWQEFWSPLSSMLATSNLVYLWCTLVALKVVHEFGHAYACKNFGGAVPEMGALFIMFTPCAYVDATSAWTLPHRRHRVIISLAGMYFESMAAIVATVVWCVTGPSLVNSLAHQAILLAGIVTIGFNINPLMRYDGYYLLSDLVDIPNLRREATDSVLSAFKRHVLGVETGVSTDTTLRKTLLATYGVAAACYKVVLVLAIFVMIALKVRLLGIVLALVFAGTTLWNSVRRALWYLFRSPETDAVRTRAACVVGVLLLISALLTMLPVSLPASAHGVLQRATETTVHTALAGFVEELAVSPGQHVSAGTEICQLTNDEALLKLIDIDAQLTESQVRMTALTGTDATLAANEVTQMRFLDNARGDAMADVRDLTVRAPVEGEILNCLEENDIQSFLPAGRPVARIGSGPWKAHLLMSAEDLAAIRPFAGQTAQVCIMSNDAIWTEATVERVAEAGSKRISVPELTALGGGDIAVNADNMMAATPYFEITLRLTKQDEPTFRSGMTALARFQPAPEAMWRRMYRGVERFLNRVRQL